MLDLILLLPHMMAFQVFCQIQVIIIFIVFVEILCCVLISMRFQVEELSSYRECFWDNYKISVSRNAVTSKTNKQNWFLWLSVVTSNVEVEYSALMAFRQRSLCQNFYGENTGIFLANVFSIIVNVIKYLTLIILVFIYAIISAISAFERLYRFVFGFISFVIFYLLAKLKVLLIYCFKGITINIDSKDSALKCTVGILYYKPTIRIVLNLPQNCSDSIQKDNINAFTTSLKGFLSPQLAKVKFKTEILYPEDEEILQTQLPLTISYLRATYSKMKFKRIMGGLTQ